MSFGEHLRALREAAGLSRAALAWQADLPVSTLRNWERDRGMPGLPALVRLAAVLGVSVERFAEGVEDPAEPGATLGPTPSKKGRAGSLPAARHKPKERKARRPRGGQGGKLWRASRAGCRLSGT
jgi:transcriptional regulator with XRE-family HTH domain